RSQGQKKGPFWAPFLAVSASSVPPQTGVHESSVEPERRNAIVRENPAVVVGRDVIRWIYIGDVVDAQGHADLPHQWHGDICVGYPPRLVLLVERGIGDAPRSDLAKASRVQRNIEASDRVIECETDSRVRLPFFDSRPL